MKLSQFHGELSSNWLPLLLSLADLIRHRGSRTELFINTSTIGLVHQLSANVQLTLRSALRYIGSKLFLRKLRRLTIHRELSRCYCWRIITAIAVLCMLLFLKIFFSYFFLSLPFSLSAILSFVLFSTAIHAAIAQATSFRRCSFKIMYRQILNALRMRESCALVVLNPHHETRFISHVAPFERHVSLGSAIDGYHPSVTLVSQICFSNFDWFRNVIEITERIWRIWLFS